MRIFRKSKYPLKIMAKEAFDNLPSGICFFDSDGTVTLCNRQMHRLSFELSGRDLQSLNEIKHIMSKGGNDGVFLLNDHSVWRFAKDEITTSEGNTYTQISATDITELYNRKKELEQENRQLKESALCLRRLAENVNIVTREEEVLNMKMRVHDDIGRSVIATRQLLRQNKPTSELDLTEWNNSIKLLIRDRESTEKKDAFAQLKSAAAGIGIEIILTGKLPDDRGMSYLIITAMRECATNAARHAGASELYVNIEKQNLYILATITNNGALPDKREITEGGGLATLRMKIEKSGGTMTVKNIPRFELTITIPKSKERLA